MKSKTPLFVAIFYGIFLIAWQRFEYFVPDLRLYASFGKLNLPAKDGFSSLFLKLSSYILDGYAPLFIAFSIVLMAVAMYLFLRSFFLLIKDRYNRFLSVLTIINTGFWYYIYGKVFYDFPFTLALSSLLLFSLCCWIKDEFPFGKKIFYIWIPFLSGFILSWKPYNVFAIAAFVVFIVCERKLYRVFGDFFRSYKSFSSLIISAITGYLLGNYRFLSEPIETLRGISAYPAKSRFIDFMMKGQSNIWDHVISDSFNNSSAQIIVVAVILVLLPLLFRAWLMLFCNLFVLSLFYIFITQFSPGYAWHGFTFGIYTLVVLLSLLYREEIAFRSASLFFRIGFGIILGIQFYQTWLVYIPRQINAIINTDNAIKAVTANSQGIFEFIANRALKDSKKFAVFSDLRRMKIIPNSGNRKFVWIHEFENYKKWQSLYNDKNYDNYEPHYIFRITPKQLLHLGQIIPNNEDFPVYPEGFNLRKYMISGALSGKEFMVLIYQKKEH